jgi:hypothetical protein
MMGKGKYGVLALSLGLLLAACATPMNMVPTGGSRSDGTVEMSYEYGIFQQPVINAAQATSSANEMCAGWGYTGSRPFGGQTTRCQVTDGSGNCMRFLATVRFQCTGAPSQGR